VSAATATRLRRLGSDELSDADVAAIRAMLDAAFASDVDGGFTDVDWAHALGGIHVVLERDREVVGHAAVVEREIQVGDRALRTGYVEAGATVPRLHGTGLGTVVMGEVGRHIRTAFDLGALGTGANAFYERLGWITWAGPTFVRMPDGSRVATPGDDGAIMVLRTPSTPPIDSTAPISCDWRPGDVW
jgi:aminoglycoside 2'-N-acetyltransferase I